MSEKETPKVVANFYRLFKGDRRADKGGKREWFERHRGEIKPEHLPEFKRRDLVVLASVVGYNPFQKSKSSILRGISSALNKKPKAKKEPKSKEPQG